jgi:hypothetical protein
MENHPSSATTTPRPSRWPFFLAGVLLFLLGPIIYVFQFRANVLTTPWYVPLLATLGVLLAIIAVVQRWSIVRAAGLVLLVLVCGLEWFMILVATRTPPYAGPAAVGRQIPAFVTTLPDGAEFSDKDLAKGTPIVLVFFRGRW